MAVTALTGALAFGATSPAFANWSSYITGAKSGFQSHRWSDGSYTEVDFGDCSNPSDWGLDVDMRRDISGAPDKSYGLLYYSNCFNGSGYWDIGEWHGLANGNYFFQLKNFSGSVNVYSVYVDTTAAD